MKIIDLTMRLKTGFPVFPGYPVPIVHRWTSIEEHGYYSNLLMLVEHTATHVDAPAHFVENGATIDEVPLDRFMGEAILVDATSLEPRSPIPAELIEKAAENTGLSGKIVLFHTGYDKKAGTPQWHDHPVIGDEAAELLVSRGVKAVGIDAPSPDNEPFPAHKKLLPRGIPIYENLTNLDKLVGMGVFEFYGIPLAIQRGSASPVRAFAILRE